MFRNEILWLRRKIFTSCKFLIRLSLGGIFTRIQARHDSRMTFHLKLMGAVGFALTVVFILHLPMKNTCVNPRTQKVKVVLDNIMKQYEVTRQKLRSSIETSGTRKLKTYQNMLKNKLNARRILRIIKEESRDISSFQDRPCITINPDCPIQPPDLQGRLPVKTWIAQQRKKMLKEQLNYSYPRHDGIWSPPRCTSRHSVAIIIPFRNRIHQLHLLLQHLPSMLKKQQISYKIFVVEQVGNNTFNKGILMNAGFMTALSRPAHGVTYHCFVFHDADLLTEDDRNVYTCPEFPRHMSVAVDELAYELPYQELVGGVFAIRTDHFVQLNGYSNLYWGWGGEDDDMGLRVEKTLKWKMRPPEEIGRFTTIPHVKQTPFLSISIRHHLLNTAKRRYRRDGLSSLKFKLKGIVERQQFTHVFVDVGDPPIDLRTLVDLGYTDPERTSMNQMLRKLQRLKQQHQNALKMYNAH